jgi:MFS family permease
VREKTKTGKPARRNWRKMMAVTQQNRWLVVLGAVVGLIVGNGPIMQFTFGVFLKPITQDFGWDRSTVSLALVAGLGMTAACVPFAGRLIDRYGIRKVVLPAIALFSLLLIAVSRLATTPTMFIVLYALMGAAAAGQTPLPYAKAISARFDDRRGLALGLAMAGVGIGAGLIPQLAQYLVTTQGWRGAYFGLGIVTFLLAFPAVLFLVRMPSEGKTAQAVPLRLEGLTGGEALRSKAFWILAAAFFAVAAATNGSIAHLVPLLTDQGISPQVAVSALGVAGLALIAGRLAAGALLDRVFAPYVAAVFFVLPLIGLVLLYVAPNRIVGPVAAVSIGMGLGAEVDLIAFLLTRYLGQKAFGEIYGYLFAIFLLGSGAGPLLMGFLFDKSGSYGIGLIAFMAILALSAALILRLGKYAYPPARVQGVKPLTAAAS